MKTQTKKTQDQLSTKDALNMLIEGNNRFVNNKKAQRNLQDQVTETSEGQYPFAAILSCIDSRVPAEMVFDQGIGDVFSIRVAGNIVNEDVLGSIEYACKVAGSKIVVVMGHTKCGAVTAAYNNVQLGNISALLGKITPAVDLIKASEGSVENAVEQVAVQNVKLSIERIRNESSILSQMEQDNAIDIIGALYDVSTGKVEFIES